MAKFLIVLTTLFIFDFSFAAAETIFCYYNSTSYVRTNQGRMAPSQLDPALSLCTHLVYGYAGIHPENHKMISLNESLDLDHGKGNYRVVTQLKRKFPGLKVLLSVGGDAEKEEKGVYKYNTLIESSSARTAFINSAAVILRNYGFDGLDLAWQFPKVKPKRVRGAMGKFWHGFKRVFTGKQIIDKKSEEHKQQFSKFTREIKEGFKNDGFMLTTSVLPNVNSSLYYDVDHIKNYVDYVIVHAYDFNTPIRNPKEADYTAPIYEWHERNPEWNINFQMSYWTKNGFPANKLILGISTYGQAWKLDKDSATSGIPPIHTDKEAPEGPYTKIPGILSYPEICSKITNPNPSRGIYFRKITDPTKKFGTYAFCIPDQRGKHGIWIGYEDPDAAQIKAEYVSANGYGGFAIVDLSMDDFRGLCTGDKFPILRAAKLGLNAQFDRFRDTVNTFRDVWP